MKRNVLPPAGDGATLQPRAYVPENAQTIDVSWEEWMTGVSLENFRESMMEFFTPAIEGMVEAFRPLLAAVNDFAQSLEDEKVKERQRSKEDVRRKRKELMKRRGK